MCILVSNSAQILHNSLRRAYVLIKIYVYLGFYDQLQFLDSFRERENLRVHFWIKKGLDAMHDRPQKQKTFLVNFLLNEVILTFLSKYNGPTGSIFISVPLLNLQNFELRWITRPVVFTIFSRVLQAYHEMGR